jgi:hypothetical protein
MRMPPLRVPLKPSLVLAGVLGLAHGGAVACTVVFVPRGWISALLCLAIAVSLVFHLRRDALQLSGNAVYELLLQEAGQCRLTLVNGDTLAGTIEGSTFVTALLTVINVRPAEPGRSRAAVLMPDSASPEELRRVRVWLRFRVAPEAPASGPL